MTRTLEIASGRLQPESVSGGPLGGFRNKLINGNFDIWQRGTSQTSSGYGSADRWSNIHTGSTKTASRQSFTVGQTDVPGNPKYFMRHVVTSVAGAGNYAIAIQKIENLRQFAGKTVTVTFYAKADSARDICNEFYRYYGTGGSPTAAATGLGVTTQSLTTSWQKFSYTVDIPSDSGITYGTNDDHHLELLFWFDAGTTHDPRTNSLGQQSGTFDIARVSVVEGDATLEDDPFEPRQFQQELHLCYRYFERINIPINSTFTVGQVYGPENAAAGLHYSEKRKIPTIIPAGQIEFLTAAGGLAGGGISFTAVGARSARIQDIGATGLVAGNASTVYANLTSTIDIDAEI